ncbi:hypothetical protein [Nonomuraea sp. NPDC050310]|uniref:hypothetical protein n=1 Tax=unclassified Nonomuraea TaxID=2593643 RepID=UPI0033FB6AE8
MNTFAKLGSVLAAGALSLGALAAATPAAQAAQPAQAAQAANCVRVDHWTGRVSQTVKVTNNCTYRISFQVKRVGPDSPCFLVNGNGYGRTYQWARYANFQGIRWNCA